MSQKMENNAKEVSLPITQQLSSSILTITNNLRRSPRSAAAALLRMTSKNTNDCARSKKIKASNNVSRS